MLLRRCRIFSFQYALGDGETDSDVDIIRRRIFGEDSRSYGIITPLGVAFLIVWTSRRFRPGLLFKPTLWKEAGAKGDLVDAQWPQKSYLPLSHFFNQWFKTVVQVEVCSRKVGRLEEFDLLNRPRSRRVSGVRRQVRKRPPQYQDASTQTDLPNRSAGDVSVPLSPYVEDVSSGLVHNGFSDLHSDLTGSSEIAVPGR